MASQSSAPTERTRARNMGELLHTLSERTACGQERFPDELMTYHLRTNGCDTSGDPCCARLLATATTAFVRQLILAEKAKEEIEAKKGGYYEGEKFISTSATSIVHVEDEKGENWVAKFPKPVPNPKGVFASTIWYSCLKWGHAKAEMMARRHYKQEPKPKKRRKGEEPIKPTKVLRVAPILEALGAPVKTANSIAPPLPTPHANDD